MTWNSYHTHTKQKEMVKRAIEEDRKNMPKPLYPSLYNTQIQSTHIRRERQRKKDQLGWIIGAVIVSIVVIVVIVSVVLVSNSH